MKLILAPIHFGMTGNRNYKSIGDSKFENDAKTKGTGEIIIPYKNEEELTHLASLLEKN